MSESGTARQVAEEDFAGFFVLFADKSQTEQKTAHGIFGIVVRMHFCGDPLCVPCHFTEMCIIDRVLETIGRIQNALSNQMGKSQEVTHYMSTYGYVPLWVLVNILTLGEMSYFYANMKMHDKNEVARRFMVNPDELSKYIKNLT